MTYYEYTEQLIKDHAGISSIDELKTWDEDKRNDIYSQLFAPERDKELIKQAMLEESEEVRYIYSEMLDNEDWFEALLNNNLSYLESYIVDYYLEEIIFNI